MQSSFPTFPEIQHHLTQWSSTGPYLETATRSNRCLLFRLHGRSFVTHPPFVLLLLNLTLPGDGSYRTRKIALEEEIVIRVMTEKDFSLELSRCRPGQKRPAEGKSIPNPR